MQIAVDENAVGILMKNEPMTAGTPLIDIDDLDESLLDSASSSEKDQKDVIKVRKVCNRYIDVVQQNLLIQFYSNCFFDCFFICQN